MITKECHEMLRRKYSELCSNQADYVLQNIEEIRVILREYSVDRCDVERSVDSPPKVTIELPLQGFCRMIHDIKNPDFRLNVLKTDPQSFGVLKFNTDKYSYDVIKEIFNSARGQLHPMPLMAIPSDSDLVILPTDELRTIRDRIDELIKASDFDTFADAALNKELN